MLLPQVFRSRRHPKSLFRFRQLRLPALEFFPSMAKRGVKASSRISCTRNSFSKETKMKKQWLTGLAALCLAACAPNLTAQDKPPAKSPDKPQSTESRNDEYRFVRTSLKV